MKLSEAMMLGATAEGVDSHCWSGCLLGVSVKAVGGRNNWFNREAERRWPWITDIVEAPAIHRQVYPDTEGGEFTTIVSNVAYLVETGQMTLEQAVDWVRSVEPSEPTQEQTSETLITSV